MAAPQQGRALLIVAPRLANINRGRNLRLCVRSANQAAKRWRAQRVDGDARERAGRCRGAPTAGLFCA